VRSKSSHRNRRNTVNLEQQMINLGDVNRDYTMSANIRRAFHQLLLSALK